LLTNAEVCRSGWLTEEMFSRWDQNDFDFGLGLGIETVAMAAALAFSIWPQFDLCRSALVLLAPKSTSLRCHCMSVLYNHTLFRLYFMMS